MKFTGKNKNEVENIVNQINDFLNPKFDISDFVVSEFDGKRITVFGSFDFCYYHNIEIYFTDVYFYSGDFEWNRNDSLKALEIKDEYVDEKQYTTRLKFVFNTDNGKYHYNNKKIEIWASEIEFNTDTVLYHKPEKLLKGQRIAEWLK